MENSEITPVSDLERDGLRQSIHAQDKLHE